MGNITKRKGKGGKAGGKRPCRRPSEPAEETDDCQVDVCHVNMARLCTAGTQQRYCWLREEMSHWNAVLNRINLQLREYEPGKLSINSLPLQGFQFSTTPIFEDAAMLLVWLLDHHRCIEHFSLSKELPARLLVKAMRHGANLRHMSLKGAAGRKKEQSLAKAFNALLSVESLSLCSFRLGHSSLPAVRSLIVRSARTLEKLELQGQLFPSWGDEAVIDAVSETKMLRELVLNGCSLTRPSLAKIAELLRSTQTLTKLTLDIVPAVHCSWYGVAYALRHNTSLVELRIGVRFAHYRLTPVLETLETNCTLKCLQITSTLLRKEIAALGKGLEKNTGLTTLKFSESRVKRALVRVLAKVLHVNSTLECLELTASCGIDLHGVKDLYAALAKNNTLKRLAFSKVYFAGDDSERLASVLFESGCSHRVVTDWRRGEFPFLIRTVKEKHNGPVELHLYDDIDINTIGPELFGALSESTTLRKLVVTSWHRHSLIWNMLGNTLASNSYIKSLHVNLNNHVEPSVPIDLLTKGLAANTSVSALVFDVADVNSKILRPLARLVRLNRTLTTLALSSCYAVISSVLLDPLAAATEENHVILDILVGADPPHACASIRICEALRRNMQMLTCAVQFVMGSYVTRYSADAYERLHCNGSLLLEVEKAAEGTKEEPGKLLAAAEYNLRCNYLILANVVRSGVECYPAPHTQIDVLNDACWYHIAKYLRIRDVLNPN